MKKIYIIIPLLVITLTTISCQKSKEEILIADYAQTLGSAKMDLNFKLQRLEKIKDITANDSALILTLTFEEKKKIKLEQLSESLNDSTMLKFYKEQLELAKKNKALNSLVESYTSNIKSEREAIQQTKNYIELYNGDCKGTFLEPLYISIKEYETSPEKLLATEYNVTYSIENPLLNNVKQEINGVFVLNADRTKVISSD